MFCPQCGKQIEDGASFCPFCGVKIGEASSQYGPGPTPGPIPGPVVRPATPRKGFFRALFDFSFSEFITPKLIKFQYIIATIVNILFMLIFMILIIVKGFMVSASKGFVALIICLIIFPILFLLSQIWIRMWLEILIVIFHISDNIKKLVQK